MSDRVIFIINRGLQQLQAEIRAGLKVPPLLVPGLDVDPVPAQIGGFVSVKRKHMAGGPALRDQTVSRFTQPGRHGPS
jgi:hypothetical protein